MNLSQVEKMESVARQYRQLETVCDQIKFAINEIHPATGNNPFTGNTRDSRQIKRIHIEFTQTRGGAAPVELGLDNLHLEACEFGEELFSMLQKKLTLTLEEMKRMDIV